MIIKLRIRNCIVVRSRRPVQVREICHPCGLFQFQIHQDLTLGAFAVENGIAPLIGSKGLAHLIIQYLWEIALVGMDQLKHFRRAPVVTVCL